MSLREPHVKMSKSHPDSRSRICINDPPDAVEAKIKLAITDSQQGVTYDPINRPGVSHLVELMAHFDTSGRSAPALAEECKGMSMLDFKMKVATTISRSLDPIRTQFERLLRKTNSHYLEDVAEYGASQAQLRAQETIARARAIVGLGSDKAGWSNHAPRQLP